MPTCFASTGPADEDDEDDVVDLEAADGISDAPPIELVNSVILQASNDGASDIHFLPHGESLVVRLRVDGILRDVEQIPNEHAAGVISRLKVLAKLDIAERRIPQDGRMTVRAKSTGAPVRHSRRRPADGRGRRRDHAPAREDP